MADHHLNNGANQYRNGESHGLQIYTGGGPPVGGFEKSFYEWQETEEIHLRDYLDVIVRRKWLIITVLMLDAILS